MQKPISGGCLGSVTICGAGCAVSDIIQLAIGNLLSIR